MPSTLKITVSIPGIESYVTICDFVLSLFLEKLYLEGTRMSCSLKEQSPSLI